MECVVSPQMSFSRAMCFALIFNPVGWFFNLYLFLYIFVYLLYTLVRALCVLRVRFTIITIAENLHCWVGDRRNRRSDLWVCRCTLGPTTNINRSSTYTKLMSWCPNKVSTGALAFVFVSVSSFLYFYLFLATCARAELLIKLNTLSFSVHVGIVSYCIRQESSVHGDQQVINPRKLINLYKRLHCVSEKLATTIAWRTGQYIFDFRWAESDIFWTITKKNNHFRPKTTK